MIYRNNTLLNCKAQHGLKAGRHALLFGVSLAVLVSGLPSAAQALEVGALPSGGDVVGGAADFDYSVSNELHINQHSDRVVINWDSFNIGSDALTQFHQNSSNALAVNRVTGAGLDPTQILGQLKANGQVMVLDRNGVIFGKDAVVDVGGIIVGPGDVDTDKIMGGGQIEITNIKPKGFIINEGSINVAEAGLAAFVAPTVVNNGVINARLGRVQIGAGSKATIDLYGDGLMELELDQAAQQTLINNGIIIADGGTVQIEAAAAKDIVDNLIVNTGIIVADSVGTDAQGRIVLYAEGVNGTDADGAGTIINDGYITAAGYDEGLRGGAIEVLGDVVILDQHSLIDASGDLGGGDIKIGGDYLGTGDTPRAIYTYVDQDALILNNAITDGDGGRTIVWSDDTTEFYGSIYGRGGSQSGNGGFVETSGKENLLAQGYVDLTAANGTKGTYLLDPADITIYGNFDPTDIDDLAIWLDGQDINGDGIANNPADGAALTTWVDKSGNGNDAALSGTTYNATEEAIQVANSGWARFDGSAITTGIIFSLQQKVAGMDVDGRVLQSTAGNYLFGNWGNHGHSLYINANPNQYNSGIADTSKNTGLKLYALEYPTANEVNFYAEGQLFFNDSSANSIAGLTWATNSAGAISGERTDHRFKEFIVYDSPITESQRQLVEQYQSAKWGIDIAVPGTGATEAARAMAADGYGAFTTRYLEHLSDTADIVLQASNSITLDLQGDTLNLANDRSITLQTTNGDIQTASSGGITTNRTGMGGNITFTAGGTGDIDINHALTLNAQNGGVINLTASGGGVSAPGGLTVSNGDLSIDAQAISGTFVGRGASLDSNTGAITATVSFDTLDIEGASADLSAGYIGTPGASTQAMANLITIGGTSGTGLDAYKFSSFKIGYVAPSAQAAAPIPPSVQSVISNPSGQVSTSNNGGGGSSRGSDSNDDQDLMDNKASGDKGNTSNVASAGCLIYIEGAGCAAQ